MEDRTTEERLCGLIAEELALDPGRVRGCVKLLEGGATVPFVSRYRKEATGGMDEVEIGKVKDAWGRLLELVRRKETVLATIDGQGKLTEELRRKIEACWDAVRLEDIYLPYKPRRRTRATAAREAGLEPLAALLMRQDGSLPERTAEKFVKGKIADAESALAGACDIVAEWVSENERARNFVRRKFAAEAVVTSTAVKGKETEGNKYADYFAFSGPLRRMPSHRLLALFRGAAEGFLRLSVSPEDEPVLEHLERMFVRGNSPARPCVEKAVGDGYKRLLKPSIETETMAVAREKADGDAIRVFAENLRQLLLASPLGGKRVLAVDPGFRTGCKVVCLDAQGNLLHNETIYPHPPRNEASQALKKLGALIESYRIEAVAVGNGTAGRETEQLFRRMRFDREVKIFMVSEDGASVYSASPVAREEFPDYDVTVRGAVSIGRRLIDPLAELVKIDPKSIGVGQYQHDVNQTRLKEALDAVVESCVNRVGVNVNTASKHLLAYVSGLGPSLAAGIVEYRKANGGFRSRAELKKVPRLGAKAFEQCAGFLRIPGAEYPLDNSAVHPESYALVERMAADRGVTVAGLLADRALQKRIVPEHYVSAKVGLPTVRDILDELARPGRDPRAEAAEFEFADVHTPDDLREGMTLPGIVTNITDFGVFVDIGVKQDGLVHISQLADRFVSNPADVVRLRQPVAVRVLSVDRTRNRISLSMKGTGEKPA